MKTVTDAEKDYQDMRAFQLKFIDADHKLRLAIEALEEIADQDFRGNRPHEQTIAFKALIKLGIRK